MKAGPIHLWHWWLYESESSAFVPCILSVCFLQCIRNVCHGDPARGTNEISSSLLHPVPYLSPPALSKYLLNKWMNKWVCVIHHSYKDKWDMIPCPWGAHSLLNTSSKLNTGHASWVVHSFIIETPFHLCLAAIHTDTQMKQQDVWKCTLGGA